MVRRAVREGWGVPKETKAAVLIRLAEIANMKSISIPDAKGELVDRPDIANGQVIAAASVLARIDEIDQEDYQHADKNARLDAGLATDRLAVDPIIARYPVKPPQTPENDDSSQ